MLQVAVIYAVTCMDSVVGLARGPFIENFET